MRNPLEGLVTAVVAGAFWLFVVRFARHVFEGR